MHGPSNECWRECVLYTVTPSKATRRNVLENVAPVRICDPIVAALAVLQPGEPFVINYVDAVKAAGYSCPTATGAFRIVQLGLTDLYPNDDRVRSGIDVLASGPKDDPTYEVMSRNVSYITGAAEADGFGEFAGGHGDRNIDGTATAAEAWYDRVQTMLTTEELFAVSWSNWPFYTGIYPESQQPYKLLGG